MITDDYTRDTPAVLDGVIAANFTDAQTEALRASPAPLSRWYKNIVTLERLRLAINTFEPYKTPSSDGIHPVLLQKGLRYYFLSARTEWTCFRGALMTPLGGVTAFFCLILLDR